MVAPPLNGDFDLFVHDRQTGVNERASVCCAPPYQDRHGSIGVFDLSADGRFVAFYSNEVFEIDSSGRALTVYIHDRETGITEGAAFGLRPSLSADGRFVAFIVPRL